jgi:6-phosphogluconolactonase
VPGEKPSSFPREILPGVLVCPDDVTVARAAARQFVEWAWQHIARDDIFSVALAGGSTPQEFYRVLSSSEYRTQVDWAKVHFFWGDERAVPPDHPDSNFGMARRALLVRVPIPSGNVHRMEAERPVIGRAAEDYEDILRQYLPLSLIGFPRFHLILLGLGKDGHTASLFPGARRMRQTSRWVSTPQAPKLGARRMTLTLPVLNAAYQVLFLVTGAEKAAALQAVLEGKQEPPLPAQLVTVPDGRRMFLVDATAARLLAREVTVGKFRSAPPENAPQEPESGKPREK